MLDQKGKLLVSVVGPTAVGKTSVGIELAQHFNSEIISADSRQFFREMSIGTAKPDADELSTVRHHFIDSHSISEDYNVSSYEKDALGLIEKLFKEHDILFVVGGSGLYLHALWNGFASELPGQDEEIRTELDKLYQEKGIDALIAQLEELDPEALNSIDIHNPVRIMRAIEIVKQTERPLSEFKNSEPVERPFRQLKIGLNMERETLYARVNERVDKMVASGLEDEVKSLLDYQDKNALKTVGYQELFRYFAGEIPKEEAIEKIKVNSRRYAKRQITWFKRYQDIEWFSPEDIEGIKERIKQS